MIIKVHHEEVHWSCGDGCCDNYHCDSYFTYNDREYEISGYSAEDNMTRFLKEVLKIKFEETVNYTDHDEPKDD